MNELFSTFGLLDWKPLVAALLLPPVPLLTTLLLAWWWQRRRPALATVLLLGSVLALWFSQCQVTASLLEEPLVIAPSLSSSRLAELRRGAAAGSTAVVVLGAGMQPLAPEYGESDLAADSLERLQYGLWLARQVAAPVLFSGGVSWSRNEPPTEAATAARVAARDFGRNLRWLEGQSRDTRGSARHSLAMLQKDGISQVLLVTHGWHMRRALRAFEEEAASSGLAVHATPAPMGLVPDRHLSLLQRWVPSVAGNQRVRAALREWIGLAAGA